MAERVLAPVNPDVLKWARTTLGLSVSVAATDLDVAESALLDWEGGRAQPSVPQLRKLADRYKRPIASFFLPSPPVDVRPPKDFRRLDPSTTRKPSEELILAFRSAELRMEAAERLRPELGVGAEQLPLPQQGESIAALAARARLFLGITVEEQTEWKDQYRALAAWVSALEAKGILVFQASGVEVGEARGFSLSSEVAPSIVLNGDDSPRGRLFTLAHELAHLILRAPGVCDLHDKAASGDDLEVVCNAFAGELLVPSDALLSMPLVSRRPPGPWTDLEISTIARHFSVSAEVIVRRLLTLGLTTLQFYEQKRSSFGLAYEEYRRSLKKSKGGPPFFRRVLRANGHAFTGLVLSAYDEDLITGSDVAEYLGARLKHLRDLRQVVGGPVTKDDVE